MLPAARGHCGNKAMQLHPRTRFIGATFVSNPDTLSAYDIAERGLAVVLAAYGETRIPKKLSVYCLVEKAARERQQSGAVTIVRCPRISIEAAIKHVEEQRGQIGDLYPGSPNALLAVGDRRFCSAAVHLWYTRPHRRTDTNALHLLRSVTTIRRHSATWADQTNGRVHTNTFALMLAHLHEYYQEEP